MTWIMALPQLTAPAVARLGHGSLASQTPAQAGMMPCGRPGINAHSCQHSPCSDWQMHMYTLEKTKPREKERKSKAR